MGALFEKGEEVLAVFEELWILVNFFTVAGAGEVDSEDFADPGFGSV